MKSRIQGQRITRRSKRVLRGGKPISKYVLETALDNANRLVQELSSMRSHVENSMAISDTQLKNAKITTNAVLRRLNIMEEDNKTELPEANGMSYFRKRNAKIVRQSKQERHAEQERQRENELQQKENMQREQLGSL